MIDQPLPARCSSRIVAADLVGAWSLESYMDTIEGTEVVYPLGLNPRGLLLYTPDGFMSAQLMSRDNLPPRIGIQNAEVQRNSQERADNSIAYCGEYRFDEPSATVYHTPSVSVVPSLIGQQLKRMVKLDGDRLTLTVVTSRHEGGEIKSRLNWLRLVR